jgi:hypothetical protein
VGVRQGHTRTQVTRQLPEPAMHWLLYGRRSALHLVTSCIDRTRAASPDAGLLPAQSLPLLPLQWDSDAPCMRALLDLSR